MSEFKLDFDQPTYFDEIVGRNPKEVHGSNCIAQHECEQQQSRAGHQVVRDLLLKVDRPWRGRPRSSQIDR